MATTQGDIDGNTSIHSPNESKNERVGSEMGQNGEGQSDQMGILLNENRNNKTKNKKREITNKEKTWKIMIQNMDRLVTITSKEKVELLKEYVKEDKIMLMNLTETWLDNTIKDVVEIEGITYLEVPERIEREEG